MTLTYQLLPSKPRAHRGFHHTQNLSMRRLFVSTFSLDNIACRRDISALKAHLRFLSEVYILAFFSILLLIRPSLFGLGNRKKGGRSLNGRRYMAPHTAKFSPFFCGRYKSARRPQPGRHLYNLGYATFSDRHQILSVSVGIPLPPPKTLRFFVGLATRPALVAAYFVGRILNVVNPVIDTYNSLKCSPVWLLPA